MNTIITILTGVGSFIAGWFIATDKNRHEVFKTKISVYLKINQLLAKTLMLNLKRESLEDKRFPEYMISHLETSEYFLANSFVISSKVGNKISDFLKTDHDDLKGQRQAFNLVVNTMSAEMKLDEINFLHQVLNLPLYKLAKMTENKK